MEGDWATLDSEYENKLRSPAKAGRTGRTGTSPAGSAGKPTPPRTLYSDRFIPARSGRNLQDAFSLIKEGSPSQEDAKNDSEAVDGEVSLSLCTPLPLPLSLSLSLSPKLFLQVILVVLQVVSANCLCCSLCCHHIGCMVSTLRSSHNLHLCYSS
eukprot:TRINITY_DN119_c0_g1_i13.p1 TRINITY_DN119_c0_g1~~TRINITY_DN119_c0_g1_i13.p1  ORF type:complete len:155 (-),score=19.16 TRINITY_DN119_c0_g1_i13:257-721(-)